MCNLPGSGIEPVSPALAGRLFTTELPGKPLIICSFKNHECTRILPNQNSPEFSLAFFFLSTLPVPLFGFHYLRYIVSYLLIPFLLEPISQSCPLSPWHKPYRPTGTGYLKLRRETNKLKKPTHVFYYHPPGCIL